MDNQLSPAIIKSTFNLEASRVNYLKALQDLKSITITKDNVNEDVAQDARAIIKALTAKKDEINRPLIDAQRATMTIFKEMCSPFEEEVSRIAAEKKTVALAIKAEQDKQIAEQNKINAAKSAIVDFVNRVANDISNAKIDDDIVAIEKRIGSEKTKTTVYGEFIPDLVVACDNIRPMIKAQKESVRKLQELNEKEQAALSSGDIVAATEIKSEKEYYDQVITENSMRIHEKVFEQAANIDIVAPEIAEEAPKGRTNWKWKVVDIKLLQKKLPQMVSLEPVKDKIDELLAIKRMDGSLKGKEEESYCGILFFNDRGFK